MEGGVPARPVKARGPGGTGCRQLSMCRIGGLDGAAPVTEARSGDGARARRDHDKVRKLAVGGRQIRTVPCLAELSRATPQPDLPSTNEFDPPSLMRGPLSGGAVEGDPPA